MPSPEKYARRQHRMEKGLLAVGTQPRLPYSSIDDGALTIKDINGDIVGIFGTQWDGTSTAASVGGTTPPAPTVPLAEPIAGGLRIYWDGTYVDDSPTRMDFRRVTFHAVTDVDDLDILSPTQIVGAVTIATGGECTVGLPPVEHFIFAVTWTDSGKFSVESDPAFATPLEVVDFETWEERDAALALIESTVLPELTADLDANTAALATLNDTTLPALQSDVDAASTALADLNTTTLPALQSDVDAANSALATFNDTTLPGLQSDLDDAESSVAAAQATIDGWTTTGQTTIDGGQITADSVTAAQIAALSITTAELAANAVTAAKIAADTITANELAANAVTTNELAANAVTAAKIAADTITANEIASNAITANELAASAVTADKIAANSIGASKILIGDLTNLIADGQLINPDFAANWDISGLTRVAPVGTTPGYMEWTATSPNNSHRYNLSRFEIKGGATGVGDEFFFSGEISTPASNTANITIVAAIQCDDASGAAVDWPNAGAVALAPNTGWQPYSGIIRITNTSSATGRFDPYAYAASGTQTIRMRKMSLRRRSAGSLIVDGSITADKIDANALTGKTLRTASGGERLEINTDLSDASTLRFFSGLVEEVNPTYIQADSAKVDGSNITTGISMTTPGLSGQTGSASILMNSGRGTVGGNYANRIKIEAFNDTVSTPAQINVNCGPAALVIYDPVGTGNDIVKLTGSEVQLETFVTAPKIGKFGSANQYSVLAPVGEIVEYIGLGAAPDGWAYLDGQELSISAYTEAYNLLTTNGTVFRYGANTNGSGGAGSTHFRMPNAKGKVIVHLDASQTEFDVMGDTGGAKTVTLTAAESGLPQHYHHIPMAPTAGFVDANDGPLRASGTKDNNFKTGGVNTTSVYGTGVSGAQNAASAHNNLQPYLTLRYMMRLKG